MLVRNIDRESSVSNLFSLFESEHQEFMKTQNQEIDFLKFQILTHYHRDTNRDKNVENIKFLLDSLDQEIAKTHIEFENWLKKIEPTI